MHRQADTTNFILFILLNKNNVRGMSEEMRIKMLV